MSDTLRCTKCQRDLPVDDFSTDNQPDCRKRGFRRYDCRECHGVIAANTKSRNLQLMHRAKDVPCMDCGVCYSAWIMQFDHRDPSKKSFGLNICQARTRSVQQVKDEIAKCDIVCANCHRMLHADGGSHSMEELRELLRVSYAYSTTAPQDE